jgi:tight adherence protein C
MDTTLLLTLGAVFVTVAVLTVAVATMLARRPEASRRLEDLVQQRPASALVVPRNVAATTLSTATDSSTDRLANMLPTSFGTVARLRRELVRAGFQQPWAAVAFSASELILPILFAIPPFFLVTGMNRWLGMGVGAVMGYLGPSFLLRQRVARRQKEIQNGLADALDLLVLCLEAGSSLDQAIVKASDELGVAYPALGDQLRIMTTEMRAGKARLDAFRGFAERTRVDDVRALVSMLVQTDRFGTSIAQALRTHAETCRTKRRQRAEERAQKVGVKLVFPLVFCLFPALYVVMLGPAYLRIVEVFGQ